jgi:hypothetical protein
MLITRFQPRILNHSSIYSPILLVSSNQPLHRLPLLLHSTRFINILRLLEYPPPRKQKLLLQLLRELVFQKPARERRILTRKSDSAFPSQIRIRSLLHVLQDDRVWAGTLSAFFPLLWKGGELEKEDLHIAHPK